AKAEPNHGKGYECDRRYKTKKFNIRVHEGSNELARSHRESQRDSYRRADHESDEDAREAREHVILEVSAAYQFERAIEGLLRRWQERRFSDPPRKQRPEQHCTRERQHKNRDAPHAPAFQACLPPCAALTFNGQSCLRHPPASSIS